jgi:hypothetical protein
MARWLAFLLAIAAMPVPAGAAALQWQGSVVIAEGAGERGPWRQNDSRYDYVDDPSIALADDGQALVAWVDQGAKDVFLQRLSPEGSRLGPPLNVSGSPGTFSWLPRLALAPHDARQVFVLWQEIIFSGGTHGGEIFFARSFDGGRTFSAPLNLSRSVGGDGKGRINAQVWHNGSLDLAVGADGAVYAAWTDYEGTLWLAVSGDRGEGFTPPRRIAGEAMRPARAPSLAIGPQRHLYLAWTHGEDASADIHVARSTNGGAGFEQPMVVAQTNGYSDAPKLVADARGKLHLAWAEAEGDPFTRKHVLYARSADGARSWEMPRAVSTAGAAYPSLSVNAKDNVVATWEVVPDPRERPRGLGVAVSRDGGESFAAPGVVPGSAGPGGGTNGSHQGLLMDKLAVSPQGALAVVNSSLVEGRESRVWIMRGALPSP